MAIKTFRVDLPPEARDRFLAQLTELVAPAPDAAMVTVRHAGLEGGSAYIVQDYVTGEGLDVWMREAGGTLPVARALGVVRAIARALDAACEFSVGHGALHPRDIFIGATEADVRVTGFGIAQALEDVGARAPVRRPYAAPERVEGRDWDRRADVYALAAIAQDLCPEAREAWGPALDRAMSDDPERRYTSATELANALAGDAIIVTAEEADRALASLPVESDPDLNVDRREGPVEAPVASTPHREPLISPVAAAAPAHVDLALPMKQPLDLGLDDVDVPLEPAILSAAVPTERRFPWFAMAAVGLAMFIAGGVTFYGIGLERGRAERPADTMARATPQSGPDPVPEPPSSPAPAATAPTPNATPPAIETSAPPPPSRETAPERSRARTGTVSLDSRPRGATVTIDGRSVGQTPRAVQLSPGSHSVIIQLTGHRPVRSNIDVTAGRQTRFAVTLEQLTGLPAGRKDH